MSNMDAKGSFKTVKRVGLFPSDELDIDIQHSAESITQIKFIYLFGVKLIIMWQDLHH